MNSSGCKHVAVENDIVIQIQLQRQLLQFLADRPIANNMKHEMYDPALSALRKHAAKYQVLLQERAGIR